MSDIDNSLLFINKISKIVLRPCLQVGPGQLGQKIELVSDPGGPKLYLLCPTEWVPSEDRERIQPLKSCVLIKRQDGG
jgi:hypothetical protein